MSGARIDAAAHQAARGNGLRSEVAVQGEALSPPPASPEARVRGARFDAAAQSPRRA